MFSSENWFGASPSFYNGVATQSLRFDDGSSAFLSRTPSSAGNRKTWTWSSWIKRSNLGANSIFEAGTASNNSLGLQFDDASKSLQFFVYNGSSVTVDVKTTQVFRDVSAWYHIVMGFDTTQATASNRVKLYVNGSQITDLATSTYPSQNTDFNINNTNTHQIGRSVFGSSNYIDGYLSEVNFIDGTALDPTSFGETKNGVWIPIKYTGSYGTNGFRLQFNQTGTGTASASTIGADTSGNTHHFTSSGIVASDCNMPDSPENNFAILNSLDKKSGITLSEGNLKRTDSVDAWESITAPFGMTSGKYYAEFVVTVNGSGSVRNFMVGVVKSGFNGNISDSRFWASFDGHSYHAQDGNKVINGSGSSVSYGATWNVDDIIGVALNLDDGEITFYKNNASQGVANTGLSGEYVFACATYHSGTQMFINCGQDSSFAGNETAQGNTDGNGIGDFYYAPPSGFLALCTSNLPEPTISPNALTQADDYFNTVLYSGVSGDQSINDVGFRPDFTWIKGRINTYNHNLLDSVRSGRRWLGSNSTAGEDYNASGYISSFDSGGFTLEGDGGSTNINGQTYVAWNWKAGGATPTKTYKVVVVSDSGNKYRFRNSADDATFAQSAVTLDLQEGGTYTFDYSDSTANSHPFRFSTTSDGTHGGGSEYTTGVVKDDTAKTTTITVASSAPTLYYYCSAHSGMGGQVNTNTTSGQTNFDGDVLSVSNANTDVGLSICTYTSNNSNSTTLGHGLGIKPDIVFQKNRSVVSNWLALHQLTDGSVDYLLLDSISVGGSAVQPASTTSTIATWKSGGQDTTGNLMVAYCFASIEGFSKLGSYTGNGSTDGTFVFTNFAVKWLMVKRTDAENNWVINDTTRSTFNEITGSSSTLYADTTNIESDLNTNVDFLSNGFKARTTGGHRNASGTYIYMAFAENPFKYANAR